MSKIDTSAEASAQVAYQLRYLPDDQLALKQTRDDFAAHVEALARALAEAEARGMERAAGICDESYALSGRQLAPCIRAAAQEIKR
jgi:hypothetical protein